MTVKLSGSAARVVDDLSRRRFLTWVGGGVAAVAAGLGFERLSPAFATGMACETISRTIPGGLRFFIRRCVKTAADCPRHGGGDPSFELCREFASRRCAEGLHCETDKDCLATLRRPGAFVPRCRVVQGPCPHEECPPETPICCSCEARTAGAGVECGCECV